MQDVVVWACVIFSGACLAFYFGYVAVITMAARTAGRKAELLTQKDAAGVDLLPSGDDAKKYADALATLVAALDKATPSLIALLSSLGFMLIAAATAGAFASPKGQLEQHADAGAKDKDKDKGNADAGRKPKAPNATEKPKDPNVSTTHALAGGDHH